MAAVAHAIWNLSSKRASAAGAARFVWLMSVSGAALYAPVVAASVVISPPHLTTRSWVFMAGTAVLQTGYFVFLQRAYRVGDLSLVYPVGRGSGALLAALAGILLLGERPGPTGLLGIVLLVTGVIVLGLPGRTNRVAAPPAPTARAAVLSATGPRAAMGTPAAGAAHAAMARSAAVRYAMATGVFIASYTLWDKIAVTSVGIPPLLQDYASLAGMTLALAPAALAGSRRTALMWHTYRRQVLVAAVLSPLAYILVLAAMSFTSISAVAPAREISVLFGVVLGRRLLGEEGLARRLTGAIAIVAGIVAVAVS